MDKLIAVTERVSFSEAGGRRQGLLDQLRDVVLLAGEHYPEIASSPLYDVGLKRNGEEVEVTLYFET